MFVFWVLQIGFIAGSIGSGKARCRNDLAVILRPPVEVYNGQKVSSFHQRLRVNISGSRRYSRDPCCPATTSSLTLSRSIWQECVVRKLRKYPSIRRIGRVRISAKSGCKYSRANCDAGVYVRNLPSTCLCLRLQGLQDRRGCRPHEAR